MQLLREWRNDISIRYYFNVCSAVCLFCSLQGIIQFAAGGDASREPALATKRVWYFRIVPRSHVVIGEVGISAEKPLNQVTVVVEHEYNGFQSAPPELADLLGRQLVRSIAGHQNYTTVPSGDRCAKGSWRGPSDRAPQSLVMEGGTLGISAKASPMADVPVSVKRISLGLRKFAQRG